MHAHAFISPGLPDIRVERPDVVQVLKRGLARKATVVAAPAGYGKTHALVAWFSDHASGKSWLTIGEHPPDGSEFLALLAESLSVAVPPVRRLVDSEFTAPQDHLAAAAALLGEIEAHRDDVVSVIDRYDRAASPGVDLVMRALINQMPANWKIVLCGRTMPAVGLARLRVEHEIAEVGPTDLRFTVADTLAYLQQHLGSSFGSSDAAVLRAATNGWIAGIEMACDAARSSKDVRAAIRSFSGSHSMVVDYVSTEVAQCLSRLDREFVLGTSSVAQLDKGLILALTQDRRAPSALSSLAESETFLWALDGPGGLRVEYDPVFAVAFAESFARDQPDSYQRHRSRAHQWFIEHGMVGEAIAFLAGGDPAEANDALQMVLEYPDESADEMSESQLARIVELVDDSADRAIELVAFAAFGAVETGSDDKATLLEALRLAIAGIGDADRADAYAFAAEWLELRSLLKAADLDGALQLAAKLEDWLRSSPPASTGPWTGVARVAATLARTYWLLGDEERAVRLLGDFLGPSESQGARREGFGIWSLIEAGRRRPKVAQRLADLCPRGSRSPREDYADLALLWSGELPSRSRLRDEVPTAASQGSEKDCLRALIQSGLARRSGRYDDAADALAAARLVAVRLGFPGLHRAVEAQSRLQQQTSVSWSDLSHRELEVLALLPSSMTRREIADRMFISVNTTKTHVRNIYRKLGVSSRSEAVEKAISLGLIDRYQISSGR